MHLFLVISIVLGIFIHHVNCARILGVFQMPCISHQAVFQPIWRELSLRGHEVIIVTPNPIKDKSLINLTEIDVSATNVPIMDKYGFQFFMNKERAIHTKIPKMFDMNNELAEAILRNEEFIRIYNDTNQKFDLVIAQTYFIPTLYSLAYKLKAPLIGVSSMGGWIGTHIAMGNPTPPSLYSEMFLPYHGHMTFSERFRSSLYNIWVRYFIAFEGHPKSDRIARKYLGNNLPYIGEIEKSMSLLFLESNPILYEPRPTVPTVISLEQIHVRPANPLPKDLQDLLDSSQGVVYYSLGSNVKSVNTTQKLKDKLIEAFSELPYTILWKYEANATVEYPKNIVIRKWLPQQDILAHPNVKVFFTQCGLQSVEEAVARGVPIVGMPFIADQEMNMRRLIKRGVAVGLDYNTATKEDIKNAIRDVAENDRYKRNMKKLGALWIDQPQPSMERAMWWVEYVLRYNGTEHLKSPTADVSWFEYLLVDVILVVVAIVNCASFIIFKLVKYLLRIILSYNKAKLS